MKKWHSFLCDRELVFLSHKNPLGDRTGVGKGGDYYNPTQAENLAGKILSRIDSRHD